MGDAQLALDLLLTDSFDEANQLAQRLESVNDQRRAIEPSCPKSPKPRPPKPTRASVRWWLPAKAGTKA